jgi:hemoglobin
MKVHSLFNLFSTVVCPLILIGSSVASAQGKMPTDAEQVAGLQKMCSDSSAAISKRNAQKSLFERLGKRTKIKALAGNILAAHLKNEKIKHMFTHVKKAEFITNVTDFLVTGTGGKAEYHGRDMATAHKHLKVTNGDFLSAGGDVQSVMKNMKYGENEIQEVVCALAAFIPVVVVQ